MRAAVCRAFGEPLEIEDVELSAPRPGQVEVEISACAVCHSDIHYMDGAWGGDLPAVYGHEAAGWVRSLGQGVAGLAEGDPALVTLIRSCGSCPCCSSGFPANCEVPREPLERSPLRDMTGKPIQQGLQAGGLCGTRRRRREPGPETAWRHRSRRGLPSRMRRDHRFRCRHKYRPRQTWKRRRRDRRGRRRAEQHPGGGNCRGGADCRRGHASRKARRRARVRGDARRQCVGRRCPSAGPETDRRTRRRLRVRDGGCGRPHTGRRPGSSRRRENSWRSA